VIANSFRARGDGVLYQTAIKKTTKKFLLSAYLPSCEFNLIMKFTAVQNSRSGMVKAVLLLGI
jgi:hypothetical protein